MECAAATYSYMAQSLNDYGELLFGIGIIFHPQERAFFEKWFGDELHFPMPLLIAFLAKGAEFSAGQVAATDVNKKPVCD